MIKYMNSEWEAKHKITFMKQKLRNRWRQVIDGPKITLDPNDPSTWRSEFFESDFEEQIEKQLYMKDKPKPVTAPKAASNPVNSPKPAAKRTKASNPVNSPKPAAKR